MNAETVGKSSGFNSKFETDINLQDIKQASSGVFMAELNQKKAEDASQAAQEAIEAAKHQGEQQANADQQNGQNDQYIDLHSGPVETDRIQHEPEQKPDLTQPESDLAQSEPEQTNSAEKEADRKLEDLSDIELNQRVQELSAPLNEMEYGTPEFNEEFAKIRDEILEIAREQNKRYRALKQKQNATTTSIDQITDQAITKAKQTEATPNPIDIGQIVDQAIANTNQSDPISNPIKSPAEVKRGKLPLRERLKKTKLWKKVVSAAVAGALLIGFVGFGATALNNANNNAYAGGNDDRIEKEYNAEIKVGSPESYRGVFADESGETYNQDKEGLYNFAPASMLSDVQNDAQGTKDAVKRVALQTESLASYVHNLNAEDSAALGIKEGMSLQEINKLLETNDDFCQVVYNNFSKMLDQSEVNWSTVTGSYDNVYMAKANNDQSVTKENTELVACTTQEDGTQVAVIKLAGGSTKTVKLSCAQPIDQQGKMNLTGTTIIQPSDNPQPSPTPDPDPPKPDPDPWGKSGDTHAGDGIFNKDLVNPDSQVTEYQSDHANDGNKGGQSAEEVDHGEVDRGGNKQQETSPDRGKTHSDAEQEQRVHDGDF